MAVCKCATYLTPCCFAGEELEKSETSYVTPSLIGNLMWRMVFFSNNIFFKKNLIIYNRNNIDVLLNRW